MAESFSPNVFVVEKTVALSTMIPSIRLVDDDLGRFAERAGYAVLFPGIVLIAILLDVSSDVFLYLLENLVAIKGEVFFEVF